MNESTPVPRPTGPGKITYEISVASRGQTYKGAPLRHIRRVKLTATAVGCQRQAAKEALCEVFAELSRPDNELDLNSATCKKCIRIHKRLIKVSTA